MTHRMTFALLVGSAALVLAALIGPGKPVTAEETKTPSYIGPRKCKKCHIKQYKTWSKKKLAQAYEALKPGNSAEKKKAAKLDIKRDYTQDVTCLKCHTTGYGSATGFPALVKGKTWTVKEQARAKLFGAVACESCHGAGSLYAAYKKDHKDYKRADLAARGALTPMQESTCQTCHVKECPTMGADYKFDFKERKKSDGMHIHVKLKRKH